MTLQGQIIKICFKWLKMGDNFIVTIDNYWEIIYELSFVDLEFDLEMTLQGQIIKIRFKWLKMGDNGIVTIDN